MVVGLLFVIAIIFTALAVFGIYKNIPTVMISGVLSLGLIILKVVDRFGIFDENSRDK